MKGAQQDPLVRDLTLLARRAVRHAARVERLGSTGRTVNYSMTERMSNSVRQASLPPLPAKKLLVSNDALSLEHWNAANSREEFPSKPILRSRLHNSALPQNKLASALRQKRVERLKASPLYSASFGRISGLPTVPQRLMQTIHPPSQSEEKVKKQFEKTGPTNWSVEDLNRKYRDELLREGAHQASLQAQALRLKMAKSGTIISAVELKRHPLLISAYQQIEAANMLCLGRGRARCVARRFVLDVHQIWLTNLDHLEDASRGITSRHLRIDVAAILGVRSQIQSVATQHYWHVDAPRVSTHTISTLRPGQDKTLRLPSITKLDFANVMPNPVDVTLLASEHLFQNGIAYEVCIVRQFWFCSDLPPKWRLVFYDPFTGVKMTAYVYEHEILRHKPKDLHEFAPQTSRPQPAQRILIHTQGCLVQSSNHKMVAAICQVFFYTPHPNDQNRIPFFDFVFLPSNGSTFHSWQVRLDVLDVIAQLGLSHAPCTWAEWWCQAGQCHLFALLVNQFAWHFGALTLWLAREDSSLTWGFNFRSLATCAIWLLDFLTIDTCESGFPSTSIFESKLCLNDEEGPGLARTSPSVDHRNAASLSICVSGAWDRIFEVPGMTSVGKHGLGVDNTRCRRMLPDQGSDTPDADRTEAVASLYRNDVNLLNGIVVHVAQAIDCVMFPPRHASWDNRNLNPPDAFELSRMFYIPALRGGHLSRCTCEFESLATSKVSRCLVVQTGIINLVDRNLGFQAQTRGGQPHHRNVPEVDDRGFRVTARCVLLVPTPHMHLLLCSLTQNGATPNKGALTGRNTRHSDKVCRSVLSRLRIVDDYAGILHKREHQGANDPGFYTVRLQHDMFRTLSRNNLAASKQQIRIEQQRRHLEDKERRLEQKIFQGKAMLAETRRFRAHGVRPKNSQSDVCEREDEDCADANRKGQEHSRQFEKHTIHTDDLLTDLASRLGVSRFHVVQSSSNRVTESVGKHVRNKHTEAQRVSPLRQDPSMNEQLQLPPINLTNLASANSMETEVAWRRLHRGTRAKMTLKSSFMQAHIQGAIDSVGNTASQPMIVGMVHAASGVEYENPAFSIVPNDCILVTEVLEATVRSLEYQKGLPPDTAMSAKDRLLAQSGKATSTITDQFTELENIAFVRCKLGHTDGVEECLDQEVAIENRDEHGNTLVIISAQQNNKKMLKLLLRRGADINAQNSTGNTALHYANEYKFNVLADYIINKGGNDSLLNMKGLTCYEGVGGAGERLGS